MRAKQEVATQAYAQALEAKEAARSALLAAERGASEAEAALEHRRAELEASKVGRGRGAGCGGTRPDGGTGALRSDGLRTVGLPPRATCAPQLAPTSAAGLLRTCACCLPAPKLVPLSSHAGRQRQAGAGGGGAAGAVRRRDAPGGRGQASWAGRGQRGWRVQGGQQAPLLGGAAEAAHNRPCLLRRLRAGRSSMATCRSCWRRLSERPLRACLPS